MKDTFYFSHDYYSRNDPKMVRLFMKHGLSGIGAYWCIVEMLYEESGYLNLSEYERITFELRTEENVIQYIIFDSELFSNNGEKFWSETAILRLKKRAEKSEKARKSIENRWTKERQNTDVIRSYYDGNTIKERKEKKIKEKEIERENTPTPEKHFLISIEELENYLVSQEQWIDVICMQNKIDKCVAADWIRKFVEKLKSENVNDKTPSDAYSHFSNWLKYELQKTQSNGTTKQQYNSTGFARKGYDPNNGIGDGKLMSETRRPTIFGSDGTVTKGTV